jgi:transketolase
MRKQFIKTLQNILYTDTKAVLMLGDIGVFGFRNELKCLPERVYNIGILEQSTVSVAAGLSKTGLIPFVHTIAPFLIERAFEQLKVDFGYQKLNGNFISVGASYDYAALGCTHHCPGDVGSLLNIPNMQIVVPGTSAEFDKLILQSYNNNNPTYYRLSETENQNNQNVEFGKGVVIQQGTQATVICFGNMLDSVYESCKNKDVTLLYYTTVFPFDAELLQQNFNKKIIVCEPFYIGSVNHLITKELTDKQYTIFNIGIPRQFLTNYGTKKEHDTFLGLDFFGIDSKINKWLAL